MKKLVLCWADYSKEGHCYVGYALVPFAVVEIENPEEFRFNFPSLARALNAADPQTFPPYYGDFWRSVVVAGFGEVIDELVGFYFEENNIEEEKRDLLWDEAEKEALKELGNLPHYRV
jgi:hypothetical protein